MSNFSHDTIIAFMIERLEVTKIKVISDKENRKIVGNRILHYICNMTNIEQTA